MLSSFFHRPQLVEFQQLELLDLNENSIESLDCAWFDALPRLRTLMLENNGMEEIKGKFRLAQARVSAGVVKMPLFKNKNKKQNARVPNPGTRILKIQTIRVTLFPNAVRDARAYLYRTNICTICTDYDSCSLSHNTHIFGSIRLSAPAMHFTLFRKYEKLLSRHLHF